MAQRDDEFEDKPAVRTKVPLMVGLMGPSGGGKTLSALRVATGIQRVSGGDIFMIDTEARRGLHYADSFKFRHLEFGAPFGPLRYLAAIEHCVRKGAGVVIVDSMSHEHEGPGGVLEMHEDELEKMGGRAADSFRAWSKPKAERRRLINSILQMQCNFVFCFRAKEKAKPGKNAQGKNDLVQMGFMPIAGEEFVFEMTANALLLPNANGIPTWQSDSIGESAMIKWPRQFRDICAPGVQLSEDVGEKMARWAAGSTPATFRAGSAEWLGKPLASAPLDVLTRYRHACNEGLAKKKNGEAESLRAHIAEVDAEISSRAASVFDGDEGGDGYSANEAEAEAMASAND
jgi:hypothetical protein